MATKQEWIKSIIYLAGHLEETSDDDLNEKLEEIEEDIQGLRELLFSTHSI